MGESNENVQNEMETGIRYMSLGLSVRGVREALGSTLSFCSNSRNVPQDPEQQYIE